MSQKLNAVDKELQGGYYAYAWSDVFWKLERIAQELQRRHVLQSDQLHRTSHSQSDQLHQTMHEVAKIEQNHSRGGHKTSTR